MLQRAFAGLALIALDFNLLALDRAAEHKVVASPLYAKNETVVGQCGQITMIRQAHVPHGLSQVRST